MQSKFFTLFVALILLFIISFNRDGFKTSDSGLHYKLFVKGGGGGLRAKIGDFMMLNMLVKSEHDSVLLDTRVRHQAIATLLLTPSFRGGIEEGFGMLGVGDSGVFRVCADSIYMKTFQKPIPGGIRKGSMLTFYISMEKITPKDEYEALQKQKEEEYLKSIADRKEREPEAILKYVEGHKIGVKPTVSGLYFINKMVGNGAKAVQGKLVKVKYIGKFLDGSVFQQSDVEHPFYEFHFMQHEVIAGLDEAVGMMKEGGKATIVVPSSIGYGDNGQGKIIPPYSPLVFDIELVEVGK